MLPSPDHKVCNAADQVGDKTSVFHWYKRLIALRKEMEVLVYGRFELLSALHEDIFAYTRTIIKAGTTDEEESVLVILNFRERNVAYEIPEEVKNADKAQCIIGSYEATENYAQPQIEGGSITLRPYEGLLFHL
jgi:oligo-1,6-glucosidase